MTSPLNPSRLRSGKDVPEEKKVTRYEHWVEWFEKCAIDLCSNETKSALQKLARVRAEKDIDRLAPTVRFEEGSEESRDFLDRMRDKDGRNPGFAWREMESRYWYTQEGFQLESKGFMPEPHKARKHELERRAKLGLEETNPRDIQDQERKDGLRDFFESRISFWLKDVVKSAMTRLRIPTLSLDREHESSSDTSFNRYSTFRDPAPFPGMDISAEELARKYMGTLGTEERILLVAASSGIALSSQALLTVMGLKKSQTHEKYRSVVKGIRDYCMKEGMAGSEAHTHRFMHHLTEQLYSWSETQDSLKSLLKSIN